MPYFSYHGGHSGQYCRHAKDDLRSIVLRAVELGFTHYGLSEHCPRDRHEDLYPDEHDLSPTDLAERFARYSQHARELQQELGHRIELLVGFETEHMPAGSWAPRMRELRKTLDADYIVGSVHDVDGIWVDFDAEAHARAQEHCGGPEALRIRYFAEVREVVETLRPEVVGHIDLIRKFDGVDIHFTPRELAAAEEMLTAVRETGGLLDVNAAPVRRGFGPLYPAPQLLALARRMGVPVTLGDDSHSIHAVGGGLNACLGAIAEAGYSEVHYLCRKDGQTVVHSAPLAKITPAPLR